MSRNGLLPTYHYENTEEYEIKNVAEERLRSFIIHGNCGRNKVLVTALTSTINGITWTIDTEDPNIMTVNGTSTAESELVISSSVYLKSGIKYIFYSFASEVKIRGKEENIEIFTLNNRETYTPNKDVKLTISLVIEGNITVSNKNVKVMIAEENNLLDNFGFYNSTAKTENGITFTPNLDNGTVTVNGTATNTANFYVLYNVQSFFSSPIIYEVAGAPINDSATKTYSVFSQIYNEGTLIDEFYDTGYSQKNMELSSKNYLETKDKNFDTITVYIGIEKGIVCDNLVFTPAIYCAYEPYKKMGKEESVATGDNLFDQETVLPKIGFVKQEDGSFYCENLTKPVGEVLWENNEDYMGQLSVHYTVKYLYKRAEKSHGIIIVFAYDDGTVESVCMNPFTWEAETWININKNTISKKGAKVLQVYFSYGSQEQKSWIKDIIVSKNLSVTEFVPYVGNNRKVIDMNLLHKNIMYKASLQFGENSAKYNNLTFTKKGFQIINVTGNTSSKGGTYIVDAKNFLKLYNVKVGEPLLFTLFNANDKLECRIEIKDIYGRIVFNSNTSTNYSEALNANFCSFIVKRDMFLMRVSLVNKVTDVDINETVAFRLEKGNTHSLFIEGGNNYNKARIILAEDSEGIDIEESYKCDLLNRDRIIMPVKEKEEINHIEFIDDIKPNKIEISYYTY